MKDSAWRRRFLAPRISLPRWARDEPGRCVFSSNETGKWEIYTWDTRTDERRQTTDRPEGTRTGVLDPTAESIWWWADEKGGEAGRWMIQAFYGDDAKVAISDIPSAFSSGIDLGRETVVLGTSDRDGHRIYLNRRDQTSVLYESSNHAGVGSLSRDEKLLVMMHSEHGDARSPALRVIDLKAGQLQNYGTGRETSFASGPGRRCGPIIGCSYPGPFRGDRSRRSGTWRKIESLTCLWSFPVSYRRRIGFRMEMPSLFDGRIEAGQKRIAFTSSRVNSIRSISNRGLLQAFV